MKFFLCLQPMETIFVGQIFDLDVLGKRFALRLVFAQVSTTFRSAALESY
jgi:hypothetical protein